MSRKRKLVRAIQVKLLNPPIRALAARGLLPGLALLETTGRKSGKRRTTPLLYVADGDRLVIIASKGGAPRHPDWWLNLERNPRTQVQVGRRRMTVEAEEATGPERERLWERLLEIYPAYQDYQRRTARQIPVIVLRPVGS